MKTSEILKKTRALITDPNAWIQGDLAEDDLCVGVSPRNRFAVCWCLMGALQRFAVAGSPEFGDAIRVLGIPHIMEWNDDPGRTHAEVLAALDKAIVLAEKNEHDDE